MLHTRKEQMEAFGRFLDILDELREKCPWDRKQTNESLRPNTIEETYELCDALIRDDKNDICKELGDVLLHVAFYAKIGSEKGDFDMKDVCDHLCEKLIFRHPHVFGDVKADTAGQVSENWEQLKLREKGGNIESVGAAVFIEAENISLTLRGHNFGLAHDLLAWSYALRLAGTGRDAGGPLSLIQQILAVIAFEHLAVARIARREVKIGPHAGLAARNHPGAGAVTLAVAHAGALINVYRSAGPLAGRAR